MYLKANCMLNKWNMVFKVCKKNNKQSNNNILAIKFVICVYDDDDDGPNFQKIKIILLKLENVNPFSMHYLTL